MRDVIRTNGLIIAADNSGSVGSKEHDAVYVPYETVGYFSARVALMECVAAGGKPFAAVLQNFSGNEAWQPLCEGVKKAAREMGCTLDLTGSSESNFQMNQSATGIVVLGHQEKETNQFDPQNVCYGVIGKPLVGAEVIENPKAIAPLSVFKKMAEMQEVKSIMPVGSKGIRHELIKMSGKNGACELDLDKSAGPSTCFLFAVDKKAMKQVEQTVGDVYWID